MLRSLRRPSAIQESHGQALEEAPPRTAVPVELAPRPRAAPGVGRGLRILERLTCGLTVAHIAPVENLTVHRIRQIIAGMLEKRELDSPSGFVQLRSPGSARR